MRTPWTAPIAAIAAIVACCGVATIVDPVDLWLGGLLLVAAVVILILPWAFDPAPGKVASTARYSPRAASNQAGGVEAAAGQPREVA